MPRLRRRERYRTVRSLDELHMRDLMILWCGRFDVRGQSNGIEIQTIDDARAWYESHRDELSAVYQGGSIWDHPRPAERFWCVWTFDLLPVEPRQRVLDEYDDRSDEAPRGTSEWFSCDGFESSFRYLRRRGLLSAAEVEALLSPEMVKHVRLKLEYHRRYNRDRKYVPHPSPVELADIKLACDPRGEHQLLTAEEIEWAAPWLAT